MPFHTHPSYRESILFLRALANERRFALTKIFVQNKVLTNHDVASILNIHFTAASKHLHRLLRSGIILSQRKAGSVEYQIAPDFKKKLKRALDLLI